MSRRSSLLVSFFATVLTLRAASTAEVVELDRLDVTSAHPDSYAAAVAASSSKILIPLLDTPQNIQVVPRILIEDQGAIRLDQVLRDVAGVISTSDSGNWDYYMIRGVRHYSDQEADGTRGAPFQTSAHTLAEFALSYARGRFSAQLNVGHVFDEDNYINGDEAFYVFVGDPRTFRGRISWRF